MEFLTPVMTYLIIALVIGIICFIAAAVMMSRRSKLRERHHGKKYYPLMIGSILTIIPGVALPIMSVTALILVGSASKCMKAFTDHKESKRSDISFEDENAPQKVKYKDKNGEEKTFIIQYMPDGSPYLVEDPEIPNGFMEDNFGSAIPKK